MAIPNVRYLVFDVESAADGDLVSKVRYPGESLAAAEAVECFRQQRVEKYDTDFIPYPYQVPVSIVVAKVAASFELIDVVALDEPDYRSHVMTEHFWRGWELYGRPTFVSFNGRTFDMPLLELAAFRFGIPLPGWLDMSKPGYQQPRNRYNVESHMDLLDILTNFGATRFSGGLNLAATLLGKPGKMDVQGHMVQDLRDAGKLAEINDYCRCDVLDTYFVFLRAAVLLGQLTLVREKEIVEQSKAWLADRADSREAFRVYLEHWGDWDDPWTKDAVDSSHESNASDSEY
jgi:predicted PolB exonuclease-like 3'-5' exonuclease